MLSKSKTLRLSFNVTILCDLLITTKETILEEYLENLEELYLLYYMHDMFKSFLILQVLSVLKVYVHMQYVSSEGPTAFLRYVSWVLPD